MEDLKKYNEKLNEIKIGVKKISTSGSLLEFIDLIEDDTNKRLYIFLLDRIDTDKEITLELIEDVVEYAHSFNHEVIKKFENSGIKKIKSALTVKNVLLFSVSIGIAIGLIFGISSNDVLIEKILSKVGAV